MPNNCITNGCITIRYLMIACIAVVCIIPIRVQAYEPPHNKAEITPVRGTRIAITAGTVDNSSFTDKFTSNAKVATSNVHDRQQVSRGKKVYRRFCAVCHGFNLQGQPDWRKRKLDGKLPAPPHNADGHTWHHSDADLFAITKYGLVPPYAPAGYKTDMPAWNNTLKDSDIWAVITYIKSQWPAEILQHQQQVAPNQ